MRLVPPGILVLLSITATTPAFGSGSREPGSRTEAESAPAARARALEALLARSPSDSLRFELASAYREAGTVEGRARALRLLDVARAAFDGDPRYHRERAALLRDAGRYADARRELERVLEAVPHDAEARVGIARLRLHELLYRFDPSGLAAILDDLGKALDDDPGRRETLVLTALVCHLAEGQSRNDVPALVRRGTACLDAVLTGNPDDDQAHLFLGVLLTDVGRLQDAEREFLLGLDASPPDVRAAFRSSGWARGVPVRKRSPEPTPARGEQADEADWFAQDPTPLTVLNENRLEIWRRLVVADCLFGRPEAGLRGWETQAGETYVRYGQPRASGFDPGRVSGGPEPDVTLPDARMIKSKSDIDFYKSNIVLDTPRWRWDYRFRDLAFSLSFEDMNLGGNFFRTERGNFTLDSLRRVAPVIFHETTPGELNPLFLAAAGTVREKGFVTEAISLGVPWREGKPGKDRFKNSWIEVMVRDSIGVPVIRDQVRVDRTFVHPLVPGEDILLFRRPYDLLPGRYSLTAYVRDEQADRHGAVTVPLEVRPFGRKRALELSDLELLLPVQPGAAGPVFEKQGRAVVPDPMGLVGDDRNLDVAYELYGLATRDSLARFSIRYTVLPRAYVLGFDRHVRQGRANPRDLVPLAAAGLAVEDVPLGVANFSDVRFPEESTRLDGMKTVRGAKVDVSRLDPGEYALVVTATDSNTGETASSRTLFRIVSDQGLRKLLTASGEPGR